MRLGKYSFGVGDRFGLQGKAQLQAIIQAKKSGVDITPVWNKSHREHTIIGTTPESARFEADDAVKKLGFKEAYFVDADHIGLQNVDLFMDSSDFFTLDVANQIGEPIDEDDLKLFIKSNRKYIGELNIPGIEEKFEVTEEMLAKVGDKFLYAITEAGRIYRHIDFSKGGIDFITEVSIDESDQPQGPVELFFILAMTAQAGISAQTIAPKFTGRFNKGVDYVGDVDQFEKEFNEDLAALAFAIKEFDLPKELKLSVHSGSDKFSIYEPIKKALKKFDAGVHIKTAGTTWLEELTGLAKAGGNGLEIAKEVYSKAYGRMDELCGPYATVIDIKQKHLPAPDTVNDWGSEEFVRALYRDSSCELYNADLRQLLHVGYKVAAEMKEKYTDALKEYEEIVSQSVQENIFRHIKSIFLT